MVGYRLLRSAVLHMAVLAQQVDVDPDSSALPGGPELQRIVNGIAGFSLIALAGTAVAGAVWWAAGNAGGQYQAIANGKRMVLISLAGAMVIGAAAALINFFQALGNGVGG